MSSDADMDELDGFDPTTPAAKLAAKSKRAAAPRTHTVNTSLNGAGPSNAVKARSTATKRPRAPPPPADIEVIETDDALDVEETVAPPKTKAKAKGKAKADPRPVETVDIVDSGDERAAAARRSRAQKGKATSPPEPASDARVKTLEREIERLKGQLGQSEEREQDLHDAFEQFQASKEAEEADIQTQVAQLHSLLAAKDEKYQALEAEFRRSKKATLVPSGDYDFVHILTPEAAEKDKLQLQTKLDEAIASSTAKDARIKELEEELNSVTLERDGEIQRATQLQKELKAYTSGNRPHEPTIVVRGENGKGPLHSAATRMYEELTNLLITRVRDKPCEVKPGTSITVFDCVYAPRHTQAPYDVLMSLDFVLEQGWMISNIEDPNSGISFKDAYYPRFRDMEANDPRLGPVLGESFSFEHELLHAFGKELFCHLLDRLDPENSDDADMQDTTQ